MEFRPADGNHTCLRLWLAGNAQNVSLDDVIHANSAFAFTAIDHQFNARIEVASHFPTTIRENLVHGCHFLKHDAGAVAARKYGQLANILNGRCAADTADQSAAVA